MWDRLFRLVGIRLTPPLVRKSRHRDPAVRQQAAEEMARVREPWAVPALVELLGDTHTPVRDAAAAALRVWGPAAVPGLIVGLGHGRHEIGRAAAELLGESNDPEVVRALLVAIKYNARPVQMEARRALVRIGPPAVPALEAAKTDSHPWVRQQAAEALAEIQGRTVLPVPGPVVA